MNICIYGASSALIDDSFIFEGEKLGRIMSEHNHNLVFGGGSTGLMGAVARGMTYAGKGEIIGIAPSFMNVDNEFFTTSKPFVSTFAATYLQYLSNNSDVLITFLSLSSIINSLKFSSNF